MVCSRLSLFSPLFCAWAWRCLRAGFPHGSYSTVWFSSPNYCVRACPGKARFFGDLDDPESEVGKLIRTKTVYRLREDYGTNPKVYYIASSRLRNIEEVEG